MVTLGGGTVCRWFVGVRGSVWWRWRRGALADAGGVGNMYGGGWGRLAVLGRGGVMGGEILVRGVVSVGGGGGGGGFGGVRDAVRAGHRAGVGMVFS